jgi:hypothetical protein
VTGALCSCLNQTDWREPLNWRLVHHDGDGGRRVYLLRCVPMTGGSGEDSDGLSEDGADILVLNCVYTGNTIISVLLVVSSWQLQLLRRL